MKKIITGFSICLIAAFASAQNSTINSVNSSVNPALPVPDHVVIVIEENHAYSSIIGSSSAPYIKMLSDSGALFTQSFGLTHPSQPNYIMFYSGSDQGINGPNLTLSGDNYPSSSPWNLTLPFHTKNLGACLIANGKTFTGYAEGLPSVGYTGATSGNYASKHAPYTYWQGTGVNNIPTTCNQPFTSFPTNFSTLPTVSYVIPNLNDDMHNGTDPTTIVTGDTWLKNNLDAYVQWAKTHNSLLIMTFDEDNNVSGNQIATIFVGPMVKKGQYSEHINHYYILRTIEDMYGICHDANDTISPVVPIIDCWLKPAITGNTTVCNGNSTTLTGFGGTCCGTTYAWSSGQTTTSISVAPTANTTYSVTATTGNYVTAATATITVNPSPVATFSTAINGSIITCTDASTISSGNISVWNWSFGDGSPNATNQNPTHTYTATGTYTVCLTVTSGSGCTNTICHTVGITATAVSDLDILSAISIFPNPTNGAFHVQLPAEINGQINAEVYNLMGEKIYSSQFVNTKSQLLNLDVPGGIFFLQLKTEQGTVTKKIVINK